MDKKLEAEILTDDHRIVTTVKIIKLQKKENKMYTMVPRNLYGRPIPFRHKKSYNVVLKTDEQISFFQVTFLELENCDGHACYKFDTSNFHSIDDVRKEERNNVEMEAVISNFNRVGIATVLDLSHSGLKLETSNRISSEFVEIFFDDANTPKRASGRIIWEKYNENTGVYLYGVSADYR